MRAGGGQTTTIGHTVRHMLSKLEWYSTLFPRIPVPIQKELEKKLAEHAAAKALTNPTVTPAAAKKEWYGGRPEAEAQPKEHGRPRPWVDRDFNLQMCISIYISILHHKYSSTHLPLNITYYIHTYIHIQKPNLCIF